jgi:hypothetical protein
MTKRERISRPDRPSLERSLDALLDRGSLDQGSLDHAPLDQGALADDDPARWQAVAQVLTALMSAPESSELTGEARALAEFRALAQFQAQAQFQAGAHSAGLPSRAPHRGPGWLTWLRGGRPAVAVATGAVLMGGLLAVAYAGDLPDPAQRLAHDTIDAPAVGRSASPDPAASTQPTSPQSPARSAGHRGAHAPAVPDPRRHGGSPSGHPHQNGSGSPHDNLSGSPGPGRQSQSGGPGRSSGPGPTQEPSSSASISPSAGATPSPSAAPSPTQSGHHHPQQSPSSLQSTPP